MTVCVIAHTRAKSLRFCQSGIPNRVAPYRYREERKKHPRNSMLSQIMPDLAYTRGARMTGEVLEKARPYAFGGSPAFARSSAWMR